MDNKTLILIWWIGAYLTLIVICYLRPPGTVIFRGQQGLKDIACVLGWPLFYPAWAISAMYKKLRP